MSQNRNVIAAMQSAAEKLGAGSGGTRNISGTTNFHIQLEKEIAQLHKKERALAFNSDTAQMSLLLNPSFLPLIIV